MAELKRNRPNYDAIAQRAILELLDQEYAVVWPEVEAKLAERPYQDKESGKALPFGINPHHLTNARRHLVNEDIEEVQTSTRGGRGISVLMPIDRRGRETACDRAAARKRLLQARYRSWSDPPGGKPSAIGRAGERTARASLNSARDQLDPTIGRYLLDRAPPGRVANLFGNPVPGGPLDDAAYLLMQDTQGTPVIITIPIEVKNIRHWIYPSAWELYQLLDKAAQLQVRHPERALLPLLMCRRVHYNTTMMARDLGFVVLETIAQPILPLSDIDDEALEAVRTELGYDLIKSEDALPKLVDGLTTLVPQYALYYSRQWSRTAPALASYFRALRNPSLSPDSRGALLDGLKETAAGLPSIRGTWINEAFL